MSFDLLPASASEFERAFSLATDATERVAPGIAAVKTAKMVTRPDGLLPFLIYEYGLGEVSPYVSDRRRIIVDGIQWQRVRGTPEAVAMGLRWLDHSAGLEEANPNRRRWNLFHAALNRLRGDDTEASELESIEGICALSVPVRSHFWRGFRGYDVRELEWSAGRWSGVAWSSSSGVRIRSGGAKWSFGRVHDYLAPFGITELAPLGAWVSPGDAGLGWGDFTWDAGDGVTWWDGGAQARINIISGSLVGRRVFVAFRDADGDVIGYRRARVVRRVRTGSVGQYSVGATGLIHDDDAPTGIYVEAMTGFGDGAGSDVATVSLIWDATPADYSRPGLLWLGPDDLSGGTEVSPVAASFRFGQTVRERVRFYITF